jgi:hypothetical protein
MRHLIGAGVVIAAIISVIGSALGAELSPRHAVSSHRVSSHGSPSQGVWSHHALWGRLSAHRVSSHRGSGHQAHSQRASAHRVPSHRVSSRRVSTHQAHRTSAYRASSQRASKYRMSSHRALSKRASTSKPSTYHASAQNSPTSVSIPEPGLLEPRTAPDCEFKSAGQADSDTAVRLMKLDYEQQCYRQPEFILRARMERLQDAVKKTIESLNHGSREQSTGLSASSDGRSHHR